MTNFDYAYEVLSEHEGFLSNHPHDPGGITKYGISLRYLRSIGLDVDGDGDVDDADILAITEPVARQIYFENFWKRHGYDRIVDRGLATKVFDLSVNMGYRQAHLLLQRALRAAGRPVEEDGVLGPQTLAAISAGDPFPVIAALRSEAAGFYRLLGERPWGKSFLRGWLRRAYR